MASFVGQTSMIPADIQENIRRIRQLVATQATTTLNDYGILRKDVSSLRLPREYVPLEAAHEFVYKGPDSCQLIVDAIIAYVDAQAHTGVDAGIKCAAVECRLLCTEHSKDSGSVIYFITATTRVYFQYDRDVAYGVCTPMSGSFDVSSTVNKMMGDACSKPTKRRLSQKKKKKKSPPKTKKKKTRHAK